MKKGIARRVRLVGVQPAKIDYFTEELTKPVKQAIPRVKATIRRLIREEGS
jgi:Ni,Fe-hydrogenase maturation factor